MFLANGGTTKLDLVGTSGNFAVKWFNPRAGGKLQAGSVKQVNGGACVGLGNAPAEPEQDWVVLLAKAP